jgi:RHS repeat-associated protein
VESVLGYNERQELVSESISGNGNGQTPPPYSNQIGGSAVGPESAPSGVAQATPAEVLAVAPRIASYEFDPAGNRITQTIDSVATSFSFDAGNQLIEETAPGRSVSHTYDEWGNEISRVTTEATVTTETFGYNYLNILSAYSNSATGGAMQYDFWPGGERYSKSNLVANTSELYALRAQDVSTEYDLVSGGSITPKNVYVQGPGLDQKCTRISATGGGRRHYIGNQVGTVSVTLTDGGTTAETSLMDSWGVQVAGGTPSERYGFAQRERDVESGLVHMRARMYDPKLGRFTQLDAVGGPIQPSRMT